MLDEKSPSLCRGWLFFSPLPLSWIFPDRDYLRFAFNRALGKNLALEEKAPPQISALPFFFPLAFFITGAF